ncbi:MAG: DUF362 domain-containing protein [Lachnospiraceae bacterium]|nr:DUF362 domain-containing protein [Lachnospiraceae bacterium]
MLVINYDSNITQNTYDSLKASDILTYLRHEDKVAIKPNLVNSNPASDGATTHPEVVEGIILFLKEYGVKDISIIESSAIGISTKRSFKNCGYENLSHKYQIPLYDLKNDEVVTRKHSGLTLDLCKKALDTDFLINVPVLKSHCQTRMTCNLKNLKGCIPDDEKRRYHSLGLHKPIAALNELMKTSYCVVDGICGDLSFEEGGTPVTSNRIIVGQNPVTVDSFCAELIGYRPDDIAHLKLAREIGIGEYFSSTTKLIELNPDNKPLNKAAGNRMAERYQRFINDDSACSVCYSSLIYALYRFGGNINKKLYIGQGYQGKTLDGLGIGNCASGCSKYVPGCPPKAVDIINLFY